MKLIYSELFRFIIDKVNGTSLPESRQYIAILDIAGFGVLLKLFLSFSFIINYFLYHSLYYRVFRDGQKFV